MTQQAFSFKFYRAKIEVLCCFYVMLCYVMLCYVMLCYGRKRGYSMICVNK